MGAVANAGSRSGPGAVPGRYGTGRGCAWLQDGAGMLQRDAHGGERAGACFVTSCRVLGHVVIGFVCERVGFVQHCRSRVWPLWMGAARALDLESCDSPGAGLGCTAALCVTLGFTPADYSFIRPPKLWQTL